MTPNQQLRELIDNPAYADRLTGQFKSKRHRVAELLGIHKSRIDCWLLNPEASGYRKMSEQMLELLKLKLEK